MPLSECSATFGRVIHSDGSNGFFDGLEAFDDVVERAAAVHHFEGQARRADSAGGGSFLVPHDGLESVDGAGGDLLQTRGGVGESVPPRHP